MAQKVAIPGFSVEAHTFETVTHDVYRRGEGPAVIVMHEVPGLHPGVVRFAEVVAEAGFSVWMPSVFGVANKPYSGAYNVRSMARACIVSEFTIFATRKTSPKVAWMRALSRHAHAVCGGPGVGAIGMCITGGFALAMMVDEHLLAPVLSQPSLPVGLLPKQKRDLGIDDATLEAVKARCARGACVLGLRFTGDRLVPGERFERLRAELGEQFTAIEIDSSPGNPHGNPRMAHSVLAHDLVEDPGHPTFQARARVVEFFAERLR